MQIIQIVEDRYIRKFRKKVCQRCDGQLRSAPGKSFIPTALFYFYTYSSFQLSMLFSAFRRLESSAGSSNSETSVLKIFTVCHLHSVFICIDLLLLGFSHFVLTIFIALILLSYKIIRAAVLICIDLLLLSFSINLG